LRFAGVLDGASILADTVAIFGDVENEFKLAERKLPIKDA